MTPASDERYEQRARGAGAVGQLRRLGHGATSVAFADETGLAFKVLGQDWLDMGPQYMPWTLHCEAQWLEEAATTEMRAHVARFVRFDREHEVIVRECVLGCEARDATRRGR